MQVVTSKVCPAWILYFSPFLSGSQGLCVCQGGAWPGVAHLPVLQDVQCALDFE